MPWQVVRAEGGWWEDGEARGQGGKRCRSWEIFSGTKL